MPRKTFVTKAADRLDGNDPIEFDLAGRRLDGSQFVETFRCLPAVSFTSARELAEMAARLDQTRVTEADLDTILAFFREVMTAEEGARFEALLTDKANLVGMPDVMDIMQWVQEELAGRPTPGRPS